MVEPSFRQDLHPESKCSKVNISNTLNKNQTALYSLTHQEFQRDRRSPNPWNHWPYTKALAPGASDGYFDSHERFPPLL